MIGKLLTALAVWRKIKPWLEKPWIKALLAAIADAFKGTASKIDTTPELPRNHPDRKRKYPEDWSSDNDPV